MLKRFCVGSIVVLLLGATVARAVEASGEEKSKSEPSTGTARDEMLSETQAAQGEPGQLTPRIYINRQPLSLGVEPAAGPYAGGAPAAGTYWLGVACMLPDDGLRAKLNLPEGQGILVENIVPDSPAAKAGIKADDVLLKAGDAPLKKVLDLIEVVQKTGNNTLTIELLRDGKQQTITATPETRPAPAQVGLPGVPMLMPGNADVEKIRKWLEQLQGTEQGSGTTGQGALQFRVLRPGIITAITQPAEQSLPDDMTVTVTKTGKEPAKVTIKQGDKSWEATEKELDKLPEQVRPYAERMLGRASNVTVRMAEAGPGPMTAVPLPPLPRGENPLEKRLEQMDQRIDKLGKLIENLTEKAAPQNKASKEEAKEAKPAKEL